MNDEKIKEHQEQIKKSESELFVPEEHSKNIKNGILLNLENQSQ